MAHAKPLHGYPIDSIDRRTIAIRLAEIAKASGPAASNRVRTSLSAFFTWAAREGYVDANPVAFTNKAVENGSRERVLSDDELATIWRAAGDGPVQHDRQAADADRRPRDEIATPALVRDRSRRRDHHFAAGEDEEPARARHPVVGAGARDPGGTAAPHRAGRCPRSRLRSRAGRGFQDWSGSKADLDARITAARKGRALDWRLHDFRRILSTALHERFGVLPHVVEATLGHVGGHKAGVAGVYNKALYLDERRRALERWAEHIWRSCSAIR